jgi:glc operon protein GlcG
MVAAAEAEAERNHWRGVTAVVDEGGWTILLERMEAIGRLAHIAFTFSDQPAGAEQ